MFDMARPHAPWAYSWREGLRTCAPSSGTPPEGLLGAVMCKAEQAQQAEQQQAGPLGQALGAPAGGSKKGQKRKDKQQQEESWPLLPQQQQTKEDPQQQQDADKRSGATFGFAVQVAGCHTSVIRAPAT